MKFRTLTLVALIMIVAASCSGSDIAATTEAVPSTASTDAATTDADATAPDTASSEDTTNNDTTNDDAAEPAEAAEPVRGTGTVAATVTIGDDTITFDVVSCTLGTEVDGQIYGPKVAGGFTADASMSMVVSNDPDVGDRVTVTDVSFDEVMSRFDSTIEFTEVIFDGTSFAGTGEFVDKASTSDARIAGSFSGTCSNL